MELNAVIEEMIRCKPPRKAPNNLMITAEMLRRLNMSHVVCDGKLKFVHVAGTKGKGTTCFYTANLLQQLGAQYGIRKVGLFTSPHLHDIRERFLINGAKIDEHQFADYFLDFKRKHDEMFDSNDSWDAMMSHDEESPSKNSFFRFLFLLSLQLFYSENVDVAVIEVGIGGRLDSTNVIAAPSLVASGITSLGYDHMELLGNTIELIAGEKAGIIKPHVPCYCSPQASYPSALHVLKKQAAAVDAPLTVVSNQHQGSEGVMGNGQRVEESFWKSVAERGAHNIENVRIALALAREVFLRCHRDAKLIDVPPPPSPTSPPTEAECNALLHGRNLDYKGRSHEVPVHTVVIRDGSVVNFKAFCDGAHTVESIRAALQWFFLRPPGRQCSSEHERQRNQGATIFFYTSRDASRLFKEFLPYRALIKRIVCCHFSKSADNSLNSKLSDTDSRAVEELGLAWRNVIGEENHSGTSGDVHLPEPELVIHTEAISTAEDIAGQILTDSEVKDTPVFFTGSFFLVGKILRILGEV